MIEFIFTWFIENYSFLWHKVDEELVSPDFFVEKFEETSWNLKLFPSGRADEVNIFCYLTIKSDNGPETFILNYELSFLAADGSLLESGSVCQQPLKKKCEHGIQDFVNICKVIDKRNVYLLQDTLRLQCRMWKDTGDVPDTAQCFARTRIGVEHASWVEEVKGFSGLLLNQKKNIPIKSSKLRSLLKMDVSLAGGSCCGEKVVVEIFPSKRNKIKFLSCKLSVLRVGDAIECGEGETCFHENETQLLRLLLSITKEVLMKQINNYLPEDTLSLDCYAAFSTGIEINRVEQTLCGRQRIPKLRLVAEDWNKCKVCANLHGLGGPVGDLKSLYDSQVITDVKLKSKHETFPAHKVVLCARSPVFKAMFSNVMIEKTSDCIEV